LKRLTQNRAGAARGSAGKGSPERLADQLLVRILTGAYPPGARLPPERQLAVELGVDRTTLRMALKQLGRMNLITARHGSGIAVNDFREKAGLEVLAAFFSLDEVPLEGTFVVEALDFWLEMDSMIVAKAVVRMSLDDLRRVEKMLDDTLAARDDAGRLADALTALTDEIARLSGSVLFRMLNTSTRSLMRRVILLLHATVEVGPALEEMKQALRAAALARPSEDEIRRGALEVLRGLTGKLRERLLFAVPPAARPRRKKGGKKT
jgi:GntR family transcriptional repressor for pyruvate dehydrogenase complex